MQSIYGLLAEFDTPEQVVEAARHVHAAGYRRIDGFSPHPVEGLAEALDKHNSRLPLIVLVGGLVGCIGGYLLQWWCQTTAYPLNVGGRPLNSWPAYVPIMFELTVLIGSFSAVLGMLGLNGLPMPYHPLFNVPAFSAASRNKFFLCVEARDPLFSAAGTRQLLERLGPQAVYEVPP